MKKRKMKKISYTITIILLLMTPLNAKKIKTVQN